MEKKTAILFVVSLGKALSAFLTAQMAKCLRGYRLVLIPSRVKPMTLKLGFTAFLLDALLNSVENKPASILVVAWGKALNGIPPFKCGRQMVGNS